MSCALTAAFGVGENTRAAIGLTPTFVRVMRILVTGAAGFIGFHLSRKLLERGHQVDGYDGMTAYYDVRLKQARLAILQGFPCFRAHIAMLEDMDELTRAADAAAPDVIVHLAAQAGVRYSLENPRAYVDSNLVGGLNVLEIARTHPVRHLMMASTSSVYGPSVVPFREEDMADHPMTLYAATKKANEAMAHSYAHLWAIPTTMFRFFTVYGPWGRPDMALFKFVEAIDNGRPVDIFNHGKMARDFTYSTISGGDRAPDGLSARAPVQRSCDIRVGGFPHRQYRTRRTRQPHGFHRDHRAQARQEGHPQLSGNAKGRRPPDLCRQRLAGAPDRLCPDGRERRCVSLRRLVPRMSRRKVTRHCEGAKLQIT